MFDIIVVAKFYHGWGDLQPELNAMSKQGLWQDMAGLVTDDMLNAFGVMGEPDGIVAEMKQRYGDFTDRTGGSFGFVDTQQRLDMVAQLRSA